MVNPEEGSLAFEDARPLGEQEIIQALKEGEALLAQNHSEAAFLLTWAGTEAVLRLLAEKEEIALKHAEPSYVLKQLVTYAVISKEEYTALADAMRVRDALMHGFTTQKFALSRVRELIGTTKQLLQNILETLPSDGEQV